MVYIIGITLSLFLGLILLAKKKIKSADKILAVWLFVISAHLFVFSVFITRSYLKFPFILGFEKSLPLLHGPFIYLYTVALTSQTEINKKILWHFLPFAGSMIPFLLLSPEIKLLAYQNNGKGYEGLLILTFGVTILSAIIYNTLAFKRLLIHRKVIKENFSYSEKINLQWLSNLLIGISFLWLFVIYGNDELTFTAVTIYVLYIGFFGNRQVGIFNNNLSYVQLLKNETAEQEPDIEKYENSKFDSHQLEAIYNKLKELMKTDKLYLTPELTLSMVAEQLSIHPNTLSEVINRVEQKNFFDYINTLRVEEFKELIQRPENQKNTLLSLAYECGFNSKTAFNRNFKNLTGNSPSDYIKENKISFK